MGVRNIVYRSDCWKSDRTFNGRCTGSVVWYGKCILDHRGFVDDHNGIDHFLSQRRFPSNREKDLISTKEIFSKMDHLSILIGLFITTLILQIGITTISPILTLYIRELSGSTENILFVSGLIVSIAGVSAVFLHRN